MEHRRCATSSLTLSRTASRPLMTTPLMEANARVLRDVLEGASGPVADTVVFNAAAALVIAGVAQDLDDGVIQARQAIESGAAVSVLDRVIQLTNAEAN